MAKEKKRVWPKVLIIIGAIVLLVALGLWYYFKPSSQLQAWEPIELTKENLPSYLERFKPIDDLPRDSVIALNVGSTEYTVNKGSVSLGKPANPEISIIIPESYLDVMGQYGWCAGLQEASRNGDIEYKLHGSETSLGWKYKKLAKYRLCLG